MPCAARQNFFKDQSANWSIRFNIVELALGQGSWEFSWPSLVGITAATMLYGTLHLVAWTAPFPSSVRAVQALLWRLSAAAIVSIGPFLLFLDVLTAGIARLSRCTNGRALKPLLYVNGCMNLVVFCIHALVFSRGCLIVECFVFIGILVRCGTSNSQLGAL